MGLMELMGVLGMGWGWFGVVFRGLRISDGVGF